MRADRRGITPARVIFGADPGMEDESPRSAEHDDLYHPRIGALEQARQVFLRGNALPDRWQGRERFTVLELGFGLGNNFLATWQAWRDDPQRCTRLVVVSIEQHPLRLADLRRAHAASPLAALAGALCDAWPPLTAGLHLLAFDGGRVELLLAFGDVTAVLPALRVQADAIFLDGFAPGRQPALNAFMWEPRVMKAVGRRAAPGATAATWSVARPVQDGLRAAGFAVQVQPGVGGKSGNSEITVAAFEPRLTPRRAPPGATPTAADAPPRAAPVSPRSALVIGAGLAGAAVASALARRGLAVTVLDRLPAAAGAASANPAALFHGTVHADDGAYARLFRSAALFAARTYRAAGLDVGGLLRLATPEALALAAAAGLPDDFVRGLAADEAAACSGVALSSPAWSFAAGGAIEPAAWVRHALAMPGIELRTGAEVVSIARTPDASGASGWLAIGPGGAPLARADVLVLANAEAAAPLLAALGHAPWPLHRRRGQVSWWTPTKPHGLRLPVAGDGYAIPLPGGALLCGATRQEADDDPAVRHADHAENLRRLRRLTGIGPSTGDVLSGWVGWRLHSDDRLPLAGAVPLPSMPPQQRLDQPRWLPREPGLFVLTALGARGATLAPLLGVLIAAQATGDAWPLEQDLADAVDPGRWLVRAARRRSGAV